MATMPPALPHRHAPAHAFSQLNPRLRDGVNLFTRRSVLKASLAGMAGLSLPALLQARAQAAAAGAPLAGRKSVILIWMTGGPSHIDTWDVKPAMPKEIRGPFGTIRTKLPGVQVCEYLPKQAALMDKLTIIRSVDARHSNHEPNQVFQTGNLEAAPRVNPEGDKYPAIASIVAKHRGAANPAMPPSVVLNMQSRSHVAWGGYLGQEYDPFLGNQAASLFTMAKGLDRRGSRTARRWPNNSTACGATWTSRARWPRSIASSSRRSTSWPAARPATPSTSRASRRPSASATATTTGAGRRCWPGGWSRRASVT